MRLKNMFTALDAHVWGKSLRIITGGLPQLRGRTLREKARNFSEHYDWLRRLLILEPRGHIDLTGCFLLEPDDDDAEFSLLFMDYEGIMPFSGHGVIAAVTAALETGLIKPFGSSCIVNTLAGRIKVAVIWQDVKVSSVTFTHMPCYTAGKTALLANGREISAKLAFAGEWLAVTEAGVLGLTIEKANLLTLRQFGKELHSNQTAAQTATQTIRSVVIVEPAKGERPYCRSMAISANGQLDRSAGVSGLCAHMAMLFADGELAAGGELIHESIIGSLMFGRIAGSLLLGNQMAIIPEITGSAFVTGSHQFVADPTDPLLDGFVLK